MTVVIAPAGTVPGAMDPVRMALVTMDPVRMALVMMGPARTALVTTVPARTALVLIARSGNRASARIAVHAAPAKTAAPAKNGAPGKSAVRVKKARPTVARIPDRSPRMNSASPS